MCQYVTLQFPGPLHHVHKVFITVNGGAYTAVVVQELLGCDLQKSKMVVALLYSKKYLPAFVQYLIECCCP